MTDHTEPEQAPPLTAIHEPRPGGRGAARPIGRSIGPLGATGKHGFLLLLVAGVAVNAWALFPSAVESGVYVPFPQGPPPLAAEADPVRNAAGDLSVPTDRISFRLLDTGRGSVVPASYGSFPHASVALAVAVVPLRSKLQALLMLLYSRYGHDLDVAALELKLQALLRLPDSLLAQLIQHPDLVDLATMLDAVFLDSDDLSGISAALEKIDISSTSGPTEQIDVVTISGRQAYIVYSPAMPPSAENIAVTTTSVITQRAVEFAVVVKIEVPAEMAVFTTAPTAEAFAPVAEQADPIMAEFAAPASTEPEPAAEPSFARAEVFEEPAPSDTLQPVFDDAVDQDEFSESAGQEEPFASSGDAGTASDQDNTPAAEANAAEAADEPGGGTHDDTQGSSAGEPSP